MGATVAELFPHVRIVMGTVIGLGLTRILLGTAGLVQHPTRARLSLIHLLWAASILFELILFWWWEFDLFQIPDWSFGVFFFLIIYSVTLFLLGALLFPDRVDDYDGYEDFFLKRRNWFFGLLAATFVLDTIDTLIKGGIYLERFNLGYFMQVPVGMVLCVIAWRSSDRRVHLAIVSIHIVYQFYLIGQFFNTAAG